MLHQHVGSCKLPHTVIFLSAEDLGLSLFQVHFRSIDVIIFFLNRTLKSIPALVLRRNNIFTDKAFHQLNLWPAKHNAMGSQRSWAEELSATAVEHTHLFRDGVLFSSLEKKRITAAQREKKKKTPSNMEYLTFHTVL